MAGAAIPRTVGFRPAARSGLEAAARAARPHEGCGLLAGAGDGDRWTVHAMIALPNRAAASDRFAIEPAAFLAALARLPDTGLAWLGFWHSHPDGAATPSVVDRAELWRPHLHVIAAPQRAGTCELAAFFFADDGTVLALPCGPDDHDP